MKNYKDALLALDMVGTNTVMKNKFTKIAHSTEDPTLKQLCMNLAQWWGWQLKRGQSFLPKAYEANPALPRNADQWRQGLVKRSTELREYCEMVVAQGKPEWVRLAEKHGWRPPV